MIRQPLSPVAPPESQYRDSGRLAARARLHTRYGTGGWFDWVADRLGLAGGAHVLDIGCGAGWFWAQAAARLPDGVSLTVADRSEGMVDEAVRRLSANAHFAGVDGHVADAVALPFADCSFDAVVAMHILHHVPEPGRAIDEMARVLRPEGQVIVTANRIGNLGTLFELASRAFGGPATDPAAAALSLDQAAALLGNRFDRVDLVRFDDVYAISDPEDVFAYLTSMSPGGDAAPEDRITLRRLTGQTIERGGGTLEARRETGLAVARGLAIGR